MGKCERIRLGGSMGCRIAGLAAAVVLLVAQAASGVPITFDFTGRVAQTSFDPADPYGATIGFGTHFTGSYTFDSAAVDAVPLDPKTGSYTSNGSGFGMAVNIGGNIFDSFGYLNIGVANDYPVGDQYAVTAQSMSGDLYLKLLLQDSTGTAFSSDFLPLVPPDLSQFQIRDFQLISSFVDASGVFNQVEIDGSVDSAAPVPEPATWLFIVAGLPLLVRFGRARFTLQRQ